MALVLDSMSLLQTWHSEPGVADLVSGKCVQRPASFSVQRHARHNTARPAVAARSIQGRRQYQEDSFAVQLDLLQAPQPAEAATPQPRLRLPVLHYAAVFDGHGGSAVAQHCTERLAPILRNQLLRRLRHRCGLHSESSTDSLPDSCLLVDPASEQVSPCGQQPAQGAAFAEDEQDVYTGAVSHEDATQSLVDSFEDCDACIPEGAAAEGGSTAVCALLAADRIWVANCGDSRAVVARRDGSVVALTDDHKPERPDEAERVKAAGGHVFWNGGHRVMGVLSMSRAMGDQYLKQYGIIATPEVTCVERTAEDNFLLLASDGLWVALSNTEAVGVASACLERAQARGADRSTALRVAAQVLVKAALQQGSSDNITVVLLDLQADHAGSLVQAMSVENCLVDQQPMPQPMAPPAPVDLHSAAACVMPGAGAGAQCGSAPLESLQHLHLHAMSSPQLHGTQPAANPALPPVLLRTASNKRGCSEEPDMGTGDGDADAVSPSKRSRLAHEMVSSASPSAPLLNLSTERLLVAIPDTDVPCAVQPAL